MGERGTNAGAAIAELLLIAAIVGVTVFGVVRPLVAPGGLVPWSWDLFGVREFVRDEFRGGARYLGQTPGVRATLEHPVRMDPAMPSLSNREVSAGDALEMSGPFTARISNYHPDWAQRAGLVGSSVLRGLVTVGVLVLMLRIVRSLRHGDPFHRANARRLAGIALLVGVGLQCAVLLRAWGEHLVLSHPDVAPYVREGVDVSWLPVAAGLGLALLADVFRRGAALREDVEGLV